MVISAILRWLRGDGIMSQEVERRMWMGVSGTLDLKKSPVGWSENLKASSGFPWTGDLTFAL